jgi:hypothetical protein
MSAPKLSRRAALVGGASSIALAGTVGVGVAVTASEVDPVVELAREFVTAHEAENRAAVLLSRAEERLPKEPIAHAVVPFMPKFRDGTPWTSNTPAAIDDIVLHLPIEQRASWRVKLLAELEAETRRQGEMYRATGCEAASAALKKTRVRTDTIERRIRDTPARAQAGIVAKLRVAVNHPSDISPAPLSSTRTLARRGGYRRSVEIVHM